MLGITIYHETAARFVHLSRSAPYRDLVSDEESWTSQWDGVCISLLQPLSPQASAESIALADFMSFPDRASAQLWVNSCATYDAAWFATGRMGGWTFIWEANGWQGSLVENAVRLSAGGSLVSVFWNVNSDMTFLAMEAGEVTRQFDPVFHDDDQSPTPVIGDTIQFEDELDWRSAPRMSGLALLSRLTGTDLAHPSWLSGLDVFFWGHRF